MKLIVISNNGIIENEAQIITKLFEAGLESFHLRKHKISTRKTKELINAIPAHFHNRIIIHTHHTLARQFHLKGIHLTKTHKKRKFRTWIMLKLIKLKNPNILLSTSYDTMGKLFEQESYPYNYVFLSPIFESITSKFQGGYTNHSLKLALAKSNYKVIARGGVDIHAIEKANEIGFEGLAFYNSIWKRKDPVAEFNAIIEKFQELKIAIE